MRFKWKGRRYLVDTEGLGFYLEELFYKFLVFWVMPVSFFLVLIL